MPYSLKWWSWIFFAGSTVFAQWLHNNSFPFLSCFRCLFFHMTAPIRCQLFALLPFRVVNLGDFCVLWCHWCCTVAVSVATLWCVCLEYFAGYFISFTSAAFMWDTLMWQRQAWGSLDRKVKREIKCNRPQKYIQNKSNCTVQYLYCTNVMYKI